MSQVVFLAQIALVGFILSALAILTFAMIRRPPPSRANLIRSFWSWFAENEEQLRDYERIAGWYPEIEARLLRIDPSLSFEFGAADEQRYQLALAGEEKIVAALLATAPAIEWWRFVWQRPSE